MDTKVAKLFVPAPRDRELVASRGTGPYEGADDFPMTRPRLLGVPAA